MKCPDCAEAGAKSIVFDYGGSSTCMGFDRFWNEDGVYHVHDPNFHGSFYRCSKGHQWGVSKLHDCPAEGCDWAEKHEAQVLANRERMKA